MIKWSEIPIKERKNIFKKKSRFLSRSEKTSLFKNMYENEDCLLLSTGPSLLEYTKEEIEQFSKDKVVLTVKTATLKFEDICDICITNSYNTFHFPRKRNYLVFARQDMPIGVKNWVNPQLVTKETYCLDFKNQPDIMWGSDISAKHSKSVCYANRWKENEFDNNPDNRIIGPGIMNDMIIPILVHCGFNNIYTLGWDGASVNKNGTLSHFYDVEKDYIPTMNSVDKSFNLDNLKSDLNDDEQKISKQAESDMNKYLLTKSINVKILSKNSDVNSIFQRINKL